MALILCQSPKRCCVPLFLQKFLLYILWVQFVSQLVDVVIKVDHVWVGYFPVVLASHPRLANHPKLLSLLFRDNLVASTKHGQSSRVIRVVIYSASDVTLRVAGSPVRKWVVIRAIRCRPMICNCCHFSLFTPYMVWVLIKVMLLIQENPLNNLPWRRNWRSSASWIVSASPVPYFSAGRVVWISIYVFSLLSFMSPRLLMKWILFGPHCDIIFGSI